MKKIIIFLLIFILFLIFSFQCAPPSGGGGDEPPPQPNLSNLLWSKRLGGTDNDCGRSVVTDNNGNVYVTGYVKGYANFDGSFDGANVGGESDIGYDEDDIFIVKFNSEGTYQWSKRLGGVNNDYGYSITTDSEGNIAITGSVYGNADLNGDGDSTDGEAESTDGYGGDDIFVVKFNSEGIYLWSKRLGGVNNDYGYSITTDLSSNIIITGSAYGNADLNGDKDSNDEAESGDNYAYDDAFIVKFNSDGAHQWSKRLGSVNNDYGYSATTDSDDNIIVTGKIYGDADLNGNGYSNDDNSESATGYDGDDIFIVKFNSGGAHQWSKRLGGTGHEIGYGITTDSSNNIIITGTVISDADFNGDGDSNDVAESTTNSTYDDAFIVKFNSEGTYQWAIRLVGENIVRGYSITTDSNKNIVVTGCVFKSADLNGDGDSNDEAESGADYAKNDIFIVRFNSLGLHSWSKRLGGMDLDYGYCVTTDSSSKVIATGSVNGDVDLNGDGYSMSGTAESSVGYGSNDIFVVKFNN